MDVDIQAVASNVATAPGQSKRHQISDEQTEDSFLTLINKFAALEFSGPGAGREETCPLCPTTLPLDQFAPHVLKCVDKMDAEEAANLGAQAWTTDEKIAAALASGKECRFGSKCYDTDPIHRATFVHLETPAPTVKRSCPKGKECTNTEARHYTNYSHGTNATCPLCDESFSIQVIEDHVNICIICKQTKSTVTVSDVSNALSNGSTDMDVKHSTTSVNVREPTPGLVSLNRHQMAAVASFVSQKTDDHDGSLTDMLESFKMLGFTRENVERELHAVSTHSK